MTSHTEGPSRRLDSGALNLLEVVVMALGQVAPAFGVMFTSGVIAGQVGEGVPVMYLIAMVGIGATGLTLAQFARMWPSSGSFVTYISRAINPTFGLLVAVVALLGYTIGNGGVYVSTGSYIATQIFHSSSTAAALVCTLVFCAMVTVPVILGVKVGVRAAVTMFFLEATVLLVVATAIVVKGGDHGLTTEPFTSGLPGSKAFALSLALAIMAFVGFEAPAPLGEEAQNPSRTVPAAILLCITMTAVLLVYCSYAMVEAFPNAGALSSDPSPFLTASRQFFSPASHLLEWLYIVSVTGSFIGANTALARILFSGGRSGLWWRTLSRVTQKHRTPHVAVLCVVLPSLGCGLVAWLLTGLGTTTTLLPAYGILGIGSMFVFVNVGLIVKFVRDRADGERRPLLGWVVVPVIGACVIGLIYYSSFQPGQGSPYKYMPVMFAVQVALAGAYVAWLRLRQPGLLATAGSVVAGEAETVPR
jgi:amino acid transporter